MSRRGETPLSERISAAVVGLVAGAGIAWGVAGRHLPPDLLVPGVGLATAFAALGVRARLPLVPTPGSADAPLGLKVLKARRRRALAGVILWFPLVMVASRLGAPDWSYTAAFVASLPSMALFFYWTLSACPFCRKHVYVGPGDGRKRPRKVCVNCLAPVGR